MTTNDKLFEFKFFDGQVFRSRGHNERDALVRLGLGAYNPVAYTVREVATPAVTDKKQN
jgi:hypothetical protein